MFGEQRKLSEIPEHNYVLNRSALMADRSNHSSTALLNPYHLEEWMTVIN